MANQEQVEALKSGAISWRKWRDNNPNVKIDLRGADLTSSNLSFADLRGADLYEANLYQSNLMSSILLGADLTGADLREANLGRADLSRANLTGVNLRYTYLVQANLNEANLFNATLGITNFQEIDISRIHGLDNIKHTGPSRIDIDTIKRSKGEIPDAFLRGCGFSDWEIESSKLYKPDLSNQEINSIIYKIYDLRAQQSIQISPLFISYSHANTSFVEKLEKRLTKLGIRFWRDVHNATAGRLETQIDRAMRQNPTVLLILSKDSTASDWVEHEARLARELEKEIRRDVLCPIALDDSWKSAKWPARLMEQILEYNILNFSKWEDDASFEKTFNKMINGLNVFYKSDNAK